MLLLLGFSLLIAPGYGQSDELEVIAAKRDQIERVVEASESTSEDLRDGMQFRVDALTSQFGQLILDFPIEQIES